MADNSAHDISAPTWIKQLEEYEDNHYEGQNSPPSTTPVKTEISKISPSTSQDGEAGGIRTLPKGKKSGVGKKKEKKKSDDVELQSASAIDPRAVSEAPEEGLASQCEKYELMRRQYQVL